MKRRRIFTNNSLTCVYELIYIYEYINMKVCAPANMFVFSLFYRLYLIGVSQCAIAFFCNLTNRLAVHVYQVCFWRGEFTPIQIALKYLSLLIVALYDTKSASNYTTTPSSHGVISCWKMIRNSIDRQKTVTL